MGPVPLGGLMLAGTTQCDPPVRLSHTGERSAWLRPR
jgi:hypothetical protein